MSIQYLNKNCDKVSKKWNMEFFKAAAVFKGFNLQS